jgi:hypothetical protein
MGSRVVGGAGEEALSVLFELSDKAVGVQDVKLVNSKPRIQEVTVLVLSIEV